MTDGSLGRKPVDKMINKKKPPQGATQKRELNYNLHKFRVSPSARAKKWENMVPHGLTPEATTCRPLRGL